MKIVRFMEDGIESEATVNDMISIESLISIAISIEHNKTIACFCLLICNCLHGSCSN